MRRFPVVQPLASASILASLMGCASAPTATPPVVNPPIWKATETPSPLPLVKLVPGEERRISLQGAGRFPLFTIQSAGVENPVGASLIIEEDAIIVRAEPGSNGMTLAKAQLVSPIGEPDAIYFPILIDPLPIVTFTYTSAGQKPAKVFAAGSFNGWNAGADPLTEQPDGSFRLEKAIAPGVHTYKLVIDGEWVSDPSNPETDGSGYGNSILRVDGKSRGAFDFEVLSSGMPGSGPQGAFHAILPAGTAIDPATVTVLVNNRRRSLSDWTLDHQAGVIRLQIPAEEWLGENNVTLIASTTNGSRGEILSRFAYRDAPRSPRDEVIYFPMTDRFRDGDPTNNPKLEDQDVHPLARYHGGDFAGIRQKIEEGYFDRLGITTIWVAPPARNTFKIERESVPPGRLFTSYHGYWPTSPTETNPAFGSMDELRGLVNTAHSHGIAVLLDFVSNHVHEDHPLFKADPTIATPLKLPDGENNIRKFDEYPFTTWFDTFIPSLDYDRRPDLIGTMTDTAVYWLRETGADGFRHDAVKHVPLPFWQELTRKLRREFAAKEHRTVYQVGETISGHSTVAAFVGPDLLDGQFDFPTYFAIQNSLARGTGKMSDLADAIKGAQEYYPPSAIMSPLIGNHDTGRFMAYADGDLAQGANENEVGYTNPPTVDQKDSYTKLQLGFAYLTSVDGPPMIYYGDEIGMTGAQDPDNRRSMTWDALKPEQQATFDTVAALNALRRESIALRRGVTQVLHADDETIVVARIAPEEVIVAAFQRNAVGSGSFSAAIPAAWGTPKEATRLAGTLDGELATGALKVTGGSWSYGYWRLGW